MEINSTSLARAAAIIAPSLGLSLPKDRDEVVLYVNKYRNLLYSLYTDYKLFDNYKVCCQVQTFHQSCTGDCCGATYKGITIPDDMAGVVSAWEHREPLTLRSRWRESYTGLHTGNSDHLELVEMPETSVTERELVGKKFLAIYTPNESDNGKVVVIKGLGENGKPITTEFTLESDNLSVSTDKFSRIDAVTLPDLCGYVELRDEDGCTLSIYYPHEHTPRYRRLKLNSPCGSNVLLIQGARSYQDIHLDTDIVEVGDRLILEAAGRYFRYSEDSTDKDDLARAEYDLGKMKQLLAGVIDRHRGRLYQDGSPHVRSNRRNIRKGLYGKR